MLDESYAAYCTVFPATSQSFTMLRSLGVSTSKTGQQHETAYVTLRRGAGQQSNQHCFTVICDCYFAEGTGWDRDANGNPREEARGITQPESCTYRAKALADQRLKLKREYAELSRKRMSFSDPEDELFFKIKHGISWLFAKLENDEPVSLFTSASAGSDRPGFTLEDVADILSLPHEPTGGKYYGRKSAVYHVASILETTSKLTMDGCKLSPVRHVSRQPQMS